MDPVGARAYNNDITKRLAELTFRDDSAEATSDTPTKPRSKSGDLFCTSVPVAHTMQGDENDDDALLNRDLSGEHYSVTIISLATKLFETGLGRKEIADKNIQSITTVLDKLSLKKRIIVRGKAEHLVHLLERNKSALASSESTAYASGSSDEKSFHQNGGSSGKRKRRLTMLSHKRGSSSASHDYTSKGLVVSRSHNRIASSGPTTAVPGAQISAIDRRRKSMFVDKGKLSANSIPSLPITILSAEKKDASSAVPAKKMRSTIAADTAGIKTVENALEKSNEREIDAKEEVKKSPKGQEQIEGCKLILELLDSCAEKNAVSTKALNDFFFAHLQNQSPRERLNFIDAFSAGSYVLLPLMEFWNAFLSLFDTKDKISADMFQQLVQLAESFIESNINTKHWNQKIYEKIKRIVIPRLEQVAAVLYKDVSDSTVTAKIDAIKKIMRKKTILEESTVIIFDEKKFLLPSIFDHKISKYAAEFAKELFEYNYSCFKELTVHTLMHKWSSEEGKSLPVLRWEKFINALTEYVKYSIERKNCDKAVVEFWLKTLECAFKNGDFVSSFAISLGLITNKFSQQIGSEKKFKNYKDFSLPNDNFGEYRKTLREYCDPLKKRFCIPLITIFNKDLIAQTEGISSIDTTTEQLSFEKVKTMYQLAQQFLETRNLPVENIKPETKTGIMESILGSLVCKNTKIEVPI